jgi:pyruvate/2-oxoglutarate/acetoin dehydrogenase E1 component
MTYKTTLAQAMTLLAQHPKTLFVGQNVIYGGQAMASTFVNIPMERRIEFPVAEDFQLGYSTGLAMAGFIPVCIYPRFDFLLLASNQLINHLDKIPQMSKLDPHVIIRTAVGSDRPLNPGLQHTQNHIAAFARMLKNVHIENLIDTGSILPAYKRALERSGATLLVEYGNLY